MTPADLAILKAEITNDPIARGYSGMDDVAVAKSLAVRDRQIDNETVTGGEIASCIDLTEYAALPEEIKRRYLDVMCQSGTIPTTAAMRSSLRSVFNTGTGSKSRLTNLLRRAATRAEELGLGRVTESDVADAKRS